MKEQLQPPLIACWRYLFVCSSPLNTLTLGINGKVITWIESKAYFGSEVRHHDNKEQLARYVTRFVFPILLA